MVHDCSFPYNVTLVLCLALTNTLFVQTRFDAAICHPQGFLRLTYSKGEKRCRKKQCSKCKRVGRNNTAHHYGLKEVYFCVHNSAILCVAINAVCLDVSIENWRKSDWLIKAQNIPDTFY